MSNVKCRVLYVTLIAMDSKPIGEGERGSREWEMSSLIRMATPPPEDPRSALRTLYPLHVKEMVLFNQVSLTQRMAIFWLCKKLMRSGNLLYKLLAFHKATFSEIMMPLP